MEDDDTETQGERLSTPSGDCFGLLGQRLDGKYDIESVVAEGGFGVVYRGIHRGLQKAVAIKVLKIPGDMAGPTRMEFLAKFALEARTIAKLEHPAVVRVIDFGACPMPRGEAAPWMALEWLIGTTLEDDLTARAGTPRTPMEVLSLLRPVLDAMAIVHEEGVVHRDIKPANLMLVKTRSNEVQFKILDFGIAKLMGTEERSSSGQTATASILHAFSLHAAAPEQISGTRTGPWTDVHALALIVSEMITGCAPYSGDDATELYAAVLSSKRPSPIKHGFDVGAWEPVLAKALALKPAERYQDAGSFRDALAKEVPTTVHRHESEPLSPATEVRTRGESEVITTMRPRTKSTEPSAVLASPKRSGGIAAAVVVTGVLVGVAGWKLGVGAPHTGAPATVVTARPLSVEVLPGINAPRVALTRVEWCG